jgi:hypothetical protein
LKTPGKGAYRRSCNGKKLRGQRLGGLIREAGMQGPVEPRPTAPGFAFPDDVVRVANELVTLKGGLD